MLNVNLPNSHVGGGKTTSKVIFDAFDSIPEMHRCLFRGKNLGESTEMSQEHKDAIKNGTFKDLWDIQGSLGRGLLGTQQY